MKTLLSIDNLNVEYAIGGKTLSAVSNVSLSVGKGETLGLVGESGCGKSTLGRAVLQLRPPTSGKVTFDGTELTTLDGEAMRRMRRRLARPHDHRPLHAHSSARHAAPSCRSIESPQGDPHE